jgi:membrane fusion protein
VAPNELASPLSQQEPTYVVTVALAEQAVNAYGEKHPLQAGMALEADVLLDTRPIYHWVLEPLFSIKGRI